MNKRVKIITINGIRGMFFAGFIIFGLVSGFILSPAWVCMKVWNKFIFGYISSVPVNYYQGLLLWAIIALSFYALNSKRALIGVGSYPGLSPEQIKEILKKSKMSNLKYEDIIKEKEPEQSNTTDEDTTVKNSDSESDKKEEIRG